MNKYFLFFILMFWFSLVNAQELCTTPTEMNSTTREQFTNGIKSRSNSNYLIRVYFHVIRKTNGTGASIVQNNVQTAFNTLNTDFNPHGIYFIWDNNIDFINSDSYYNAPGNIIFSVNNHSNGVDIYLYGDSVCTGGEANGIANSTEYYIGGYMSSFPNVYLSGTHVVSHEMGHVLGLYHTHHGTFPPEAGCPELVNGSNADVCGDEIEDTPADPNLNFYVDPNTGQWLGYGITDSNGDLYHPDTHLIMSYSHPSCMYLFSLKQGERMKDMISSVSALRNATVHADWIVGPNLVCTSNTYYINNLPSCLTAEWNLSNNYYNQNCLQHNYPSLNQCKITRSSSQDMMDATLTATIKYNGVMIQKLTKNNMYAYTGFKGHYTSGNLSGDIIYPFFFNVKPNEYTIVTSPNFYGATISYDNTATIPSFWEYNTQYGDMRFVMPSNSNGVPIVINVTDGCGNYYQLYAIRQNGYYAHISLDDNCITVTLNEEGDVSENRGIDQPWTMEVRNATTGRLMATQSATGRSATLPTVGWSEGVYVVTATVGKEVITEKVKVK